jgi:hypothetical protein
MVVIFGGLLAALLPLIGAIAAVGGVPLPARLRRGDHAGSEHGAGDRCSGSASRSTTRC